MKKTFSDNYLPNIDTQKIFELLQDEESREIFLWRYNYFMNRDEKIFNDTFYGDQYNGIIRFRNLQNNINYSGSFIDNLKKCSNEVIIYGAGTSCKAILMPLLEASSIKIKAICDTYKSNQIINGFSVVTPDDLFKKDTNLPIIISTFVEKAQIEMQETLSTYGISQSSIFVPYFPSEKLQYFMPDIIKPLPNEVFVDAGCFNGDTILNFLEFTRPSGYKRIYGFEPDRTSYEKMKSTLECRGLKDMLLYNKGLWDKSEAIGFNSVGYGSTISSDAEESIETVTLDGIIDINDKVTFIKMDIEGAELNALHGARHTIERDRPRLAICVYHKPEDIIYIAAYILSINPEYKLFLRHHSPLSAFETVLYAV